MTQYHGCLDSGSFTTNVLHPVWTDNINFNSNGNVNCGLHIENILSHHGC